MRKFILRFRAALLAVATTLACVAVHEGGHVLAGWATGARVSEIRVLSLTPHVRLSGHGRAQSKAFRAVAGTGLVLAGWLVCILVASGGGSSRVIVDTASFFAFIEVLGWLLSSLVHDFQPQANDAGKFLQWSGLSPWTAALTCLGFAAAGTWVFRIRRFRNNQPGSCGI